MALYLFPVLGLAVLSRLGFLTRSEVGFEIDVTDMSVEFNTRLQVGISVCIQNTYTGRDPLLRIPREREWGRKFRTSFRGFDQSNGHIVGCACRAPGAGRRTSRTNSTIQRTAPEQQLDLAALFLL